MKMHKWFLTALMVVTVALAGCSKQESVNTAPLESSFKSAEPAAQSSVDKVVASIKSGDYPTALGELKTLASNAKLTPEQQQAVKDVLAQVQKAMTDTAKKATEEAGKSLDDLKKSLPK